MRRIQAALVAISAVALMAVSSGSAQAVFPNDQTGFNFFVARGLSGKQSAAVIGVYDVQSGMNPHVVTQAFGGPYYGIGQWPAWCFDAAQNLTAELQFGWREIANGTCGSSFGGRLQAQTNIGDAVRLIAQVRRLNWDSTSIQQAINYAQAVLAAYG